MHSHVYRADERPDVVVLFDPPTAGPIGTWRVGELRQWLRDEDGAWWGEGQWRPDEPTRIIGTFPAANIRPADDEPPRQNLPGRFCVCGGEA